MKEYRTPRNSTVRDRVVKSQGPHDPCRKEPRLVLVPNKRGCTLCTSLHSQVFSDSRCCRSAGQCRDPERWLTSISATMRLELREQGAGRNAGAVPNVDLFTPNIIGKT